MTSKRENRIFNTSYKHNINFTAKPKLIELLKLQKAKRRRFRQPKRQSKSLFSIRLKGLQRFRAYYQVIPFNQLKKYVNLSKKRKTASWQHFLNFVESRFDVLLTRAQLTKSFANSRQLINHAHFYLNDKSNNITSTLVILGSYISLNKIGTFRFLHKSRELDYCVGSPMGALHKIKKSSHDLYAYIKKINIDILFYENYTSKYNFITNTSVKNFERIKNSISKISINNLNLPINTLGSIFSINKSYILNNNFNKVSQINFITSTLNNYINNSKTFLYSNVYLEINYSLLHSFYAYPVMHFVTEKQLILYRDKIKEVLEKF